MNCFNHKEDAVGICKSCQKAVCASCVIDTGRGIACSEVCAAEVAALNEIVDKSIVIYGIGKKPKLLPTGILMQLFFALCFIGFGVYRTFIVGRPAYFILILGLGFLVVSLLAWYRNRKLNINC